VATDSHTKRWSVRRANCRRSSIRNCEPDRSTCRADSNAMLRCPTRCAVDTSAVRARPITFPWCSCPWTFGRIRLSRDRRRRRPMLLLAPTGLQDGLRTPPRKLPAAFRLRMLASRRSIEERLRWSRYYAASFLREKPRTTVYSRRGI